MLIFPKENGILNESSYKELFTSGSKPGVLYGLPKVHKEGHPLRPILSAIGTFNYKLAKFLVPILSPLTVNEYTVKDSFSFAKDICRENFGECVLASFDIKSLFTNIPLHETVDLCIEDLFAHEHPTFGFNREQLHKLLSLSCTDSYFIFNKHFYTQKDGVAMGNPLGPTLANAFLSHYERKWLEECPDNFKPLLYRRYIDDTFLAFRSREHVPLFLQYLNSKHSNIAFTAEIENERKLPFLDVLITREPDASISTSIYRKPTYTGLTTKFTSFIPLQLKRNLISTLTTRAFNICSNYFKMHTELQFLKSTLFLNGFSMAFCESYIGKQLSKLLHPSPKIPSVGRAIIYFNISFTGRGSYKIRKQINKLLREFYPQLNIRVIFKPNYMIQSLFKFKDILPTELQSSIVYQYECNSCNALYIGQSKRQFKVRQYEHFGKSIRSNRPLGRPPLSAIREHSHTHDHPMDSSSFSVLSVKSSNMELPIAESLHIVQKSPSLNYHGTSVELLCFQFSI